jgi:hypothetical protein
VLENPPSEIKAPEHPIKRESNEPSEPGTWVSKRYLMSLIKERKKADKGPDGSASPDMSSSS